MDGSSSPAKVVTVSPCTVKILYGSCKSNIRISIELKVTVGTPSGTASYCRQLGSAEGKIARALLGGNAASISKAVLSVETVREAIITQLLGLLNRECSKLCRFNPTSSPFRTIPVEKMVEFKWDDLMSELESSVPLLLKILHCLAARNDRRNKCKTGAVHNPGICTAVAVLLKERNREMCGIQSLLSLIMYSCHCEKQVR